MKLLVKTMGAAGLLTLAACGGGADDTAADNIEAIAENQSGMLEEQADNMEAMGNEAAADDLEQKAENIEEMGEESAEKADDEDNAQVEAQAKNAM
ncbi:MAG TPA: hypothetical protein VF636_09535 [Sphingomonas sp.]|jgi:hypothetical protein